MYKKANIFVPHDLQPEKSIKGISVQEYYDAQRKSIEVIV